MMNKCENSIMNICVAALVHYTALCGFHETAYAELYQNQHKLCISQSHSAVTAVLYLDFLGI